MTKLVHKLGFSPKYAFHDVWSIDDPALMSFLLRPALALLLVFPLTEVYEESRQREDSPRDDYAGYGASEPVTWFKQTIKNACGMIGLLHCLCNGPARNHILPDTDLQRLLRDADPLNPTERAELLYNSQALETAHAEAAHTGDTAVPDPATQLDLHFVAFVREGADLWELDGRRKGPINRGWIGTGDDMLSDTALELGVRQFLRREAKPSGGGESRFSLIMLGPAMEE
jgi:ubiquitin carboxyl-terminal hydrolase L3